MPENTRIYIGHSLDKEVEVTLEKEQSHYLAKVLRKKVGDQVKLFDQKNEYRAEITNVSPSKIRLLINEMIRENEHTSKKLALVFSPIKNADTSFIVQKATELGVDEIFPVIFSRTVVNKINLPRLEKIAIEAAEQCNRLSIPKINAILDFRKFIFPNDFEILFCDENCKAPKISNVEIKGDKVCLLIGPEGGFGPQDREIIKSLPSVKSVTLGSRILRAETAIIAAIAIYQDR